VNIFIPEFLARRARDLRDTFGSRSRGVPLRETPESVLQWSTTTPGAERHIPQRSKC
jgi:hypothetical protein